MCVKLCPSHTGKNNGDSGEQGAEKDIWISEGGSGRKLEKIA
jgi:hypothetical protein